MKYRKDIQTTLDAVCPIIEAAGATWDFQHCNRSKHPKLHISFGGLTRMTPIAGSPARLHDTLNLKRRDVKRLLREMGAIT